MVEARIAELERQMQLMVNEVSNRPTIAHVDEELNKRPTAVQVELEIQKRIGILQMLIEKMEGKSGKDNKFDDKAAADCKPTPWGGEKDQVEFPEFASAVKNWADALHEEGAAMMDHYEVWKTIVLPEDLDVRKFPDIVKFSRKLFRVLVCSLTGESQTFL